MSPARLLQYFDQISEAPDAVPRLRRFILDLAVRGKLVEQDPEDEPASELLKRIRSERRGLSAEGEIRKPETSLPSAADEIPFRDSGNVAWERLGKLSTESNGRLDKAEECTDTGSRLRSTSETSMTEGLRTESFRIRNSTSSWRNGDFLVSWTALLLDILDGPHLGPGTGGFESTYFGAVLLGDRSFLLFSSSRSTPGCWQLIDQAHVAWALKHITKRSWQRCRFRSHPSPNNTGSWRRWTN